MDLKFCKDCKSYFAITCDMGLSSTSLDCCRHTKTSHIVTPIKEYDVTEAYNPLIQNARNDCQFFEQKPPPPPKKPSFWSRLWGNLVNPYGSCGFEDG